MFEWLLSPLDPSRIHHVIFAVSWHARLMVLGWAILFPLGIIVARFFKVMPRQDWPRHVDNRTWWNGHRIIQYSAGVVVIAALILIVTASDDRPYSLFHRVLGWSCLALALMQFASIWFRGTTGGPAEPAPDGSFHGDHYDMTLRRRIFERFHKSAGYVAILLAAAAIVTGLYITNAPHWMWLVIGLWWIALVIAFCVLQKQRRAIDTYQALWGPGEEHPGNHVEPIGWGIVRPTIPPTSKPPRS
ncbi:cytochrome b561 domain-containing protein [Phyllobacterium sp. 628]|uniref:cytochrome b561 domain-containing protein n=1 Tax=Phyllobacterium sp. 628 TaxID=2718938 RepID=UPI0016626463|nr:cytochrome b561 domain-containing protein [Phyllobacterium sp. 628]